MKKPASLRQHLEQYVPELRKHPKNLEVRIDDGAIVCKHGASLSFEWRYKLRLLVMDFTDQPSSLIVPMLAWISVNQPDLLADPEKRMRALSFEAEPINHETIDIEFRLDLSERVIVKKTDAGWHFEHVGEPLLPDPDDGVLGWEVYLKNELLFESSTPLAAP